MSHRTATRRQFLKGLAVAAAGTLLVACQPQTIIVKETVVVEKEVTRVVIVKETVVVQVVFGDGNIRVIQGQTVTYFSSDEHCNFPRYTRLPNGDAFISHSIGRHTVTERQRALVSRDGGQNWKQRRPPIPALVLSDGSCLAVAGRGIQMKIVDDRSFAFGIYRSLDNWKAIETVLAKISWPLPMESAFLSGRPIQLADGTILVGLYGKAPGQARYTSGVMASADHGKTWHFQGVVARPPYPKGSGSDGACEGALAQLANGEIVCVMRTGGRATDSMLQSRSPDGGASWGEPELLGTPGGVDPSLLRLENGVLVCSFGRPHISLMFSEEGTAEDWTAPFVFYRGPGDHYTSLWQAGSDSFLLMWCHSGFGGHNIDGKSEVNSTEFLVERT